MIIFYFHAPPDPKVEQFLRTVFQELIKSTSYLEVMTGKGNSKSRTIKGYLDAGQPVANPSHEVILSSEDSAGRVLGYRFHLLIVLTDIILPRFLNSSTAAFCVPKCSVMVRTNCFLHSFRKFFSVTS